MKIPVHVLIRPRAGDFAYSSEELEVMRRDIVLARQFGVNGIVLGILEPSGVVDVKRTGELVQSARPLDVTFHRAFDRTPDLLQALAAVKQTGAQRILTSGGGSSAEEGLAMLARLVSGAGSAVVIMAAGGIRAANVAHIVKATGVPEVHASLQPTSSAGNSGSKGLASGDVRSEVLTAAEVARFVQAVSGG